MNEEEYEKYQTLVDKYSKAYYKKVGDLFALDDLAQEIWLSILTTLDKEAYRGDNDASETTFIIASIRNHMANLIAQEVYRLQVFTDEYDTIMDNVECEEEATPEESTVLKEHLEILSGKIPHIANGEFVLRKTVEGYTVREISKLAKQQGIKMSKDTVNRIQHQLRDEITKVFSK